MGDRRARELLCDNHNQAGSLHVALLDGCNKILDCNPCEMVHTYIDFLHFMLLFESHQ